MGGVHTEARLGLSDGRRASRTAHGRAPAAPTCMARSAAVVAAEVMTATEAMMAAEVKTAAESMKADVMVAKVMRAAVV